MVIKANPVTDNATGVPKGFEAMSMRALLLQCPDHALDHTVLLRTMRGDELLFETIAANQGRIVAAGEAQAIVRSKQERRVDSTKRAVARNQCLFQRRFCRLRFSRARQMPAE